MRVNQRQRSGMNSTVDGDTIGDFLKRAALKSSIESFIDGIFMDFL